MIVTPRPISTLDLSGGGCRPANSCISSPGILCRDQIQNYSCKCYLIYFSSGIAISHCFTLP